jgi:gliding motility-associated-like protein
VPAIPIVGTVSQSICDTFTGSVVLNGLPATGTWRIEPTGQTGTGGSTTIKKLAKGKYNFSVVNDKGCTSLTATVEVGCGSADEPCLGDLSNVIPDGFTPGGNGTNDFFDPQKYISVAGCSKNIQADELHIINRWGETIYKSVPYVQWDGKSGTNQRTVPTGAYFYVMVLNTGGTRRTIKGVINLFTD